MSTPKSVLDTLDDEAIARLRKGYDRNLMHAIVTRTLNVPYPPVAPWTAYIMDDLYARDAALDPARRELVIISQLTGQGLVAPLATHIYWGLVEGLSPAEIAQCIVLSGTYAGAQKYVIGIRVMQQMMNMLAECAQSDETAGLGHVAQKLLAMFPG